MSKRKKPEFQTPEEKSIWELKDNISNFAPRSEKNAWARKRHVIEALVDEVRPIEDEILVLSNKAQPIYDKIAILRKEMVDSCVHPFDMLVYKGNHIHCKFCDTKLSIPNKKK